MSLTFRLATAVMPISDGLYEANVPDLWQQGKGAFGGVVFGLLVRAAIASEPDRARHLRTFAADVAGPVLPGPARLHARVLRRGKNQTNLHVELEQAGAVQAVANLTLSLDRGTDALPLMPVPPDPQGLRELEPLQAEGMPVFARHYEYRALGALGGAFGQPAAEPVAMGYVRERAHAQDAEGLYDAAAVTALLDSWWPALYAAIDRPLKMTTVSFNAQYLHHELVLKAAEPLLFRSRAITQHAGYALEFRELWSGNQLVALNQQTMAILE